MESATALRDDRSDVEVGPAPVVSTREEAVAFPIHRLETWGIFLLFGIFYTLVGYKIVADLHVVSFDALDRLTRAFMVWYNDPPKLAAIGFSLPPIGSFVLVPFAAVRELVTSGLALPLSSAIFGAAALTAVNRMFAMADMARGARLLLVLLIGLNPMFAWYSMNGTGDAAYLFFAAFGLFCMIGWGRNGSARYLIGAGLAFSLACLTKYEFIIWALLHRLPDRLVAEQPRAQQGRGRGLDDRLPGADRLRARHLDLLQRDRARRTRSSGSRWRATSTPVNAISSSAPGLRPPRRDRQRAARSS